MIKNTSKNQKFGWLLFLAYLAVLVYFLFFSESFGRVPGQRESSYNLELFKEIKRFYLYREQLGMKAFLLNIVGNVAAFMPCGFFLPIISRRSKKWQYTILLCFCLSLGVELLQLLVRVGSFDVDDILLNSIGGILGYLFYQAVQRLRIRRRHEKRQV